MGEAEMQENSLSESSSSGRRDRNWAGGRHDTRCNNSVPVIGSQVTWDKFKSSMKVTWEEQRQESKSHPRSRPVDGESESKCTRVNIKSQVTYKYHIHKARFLQFIPNETLFYVELKTFYDSVCKEPENTKRSSSVKHVVETYRQNNAAAAILILFI